MKIVVAAGVFDYLHPGHIFFLESAKRLGDCLIVIVARDANVERIKNLLPHHSESERLHLVAQSGIADEVILGNKTGSFLDIVHTLDPDIVALGYDQSLPKGFSEAFPNVCIKRIPAKNPEKWKSSQYRKEKKT
jgi:FAD synthetase